MNTDEAQESLVDVICCWPQRTGFQKAKHRKPIRRYYCNILYLQVEV